jgi:alpha-tubulin suppressor-like RCC1 family protein
VYEPTPLESFREATRMGIMTIKQIACGENHTMALVDMVSVEEECEEPEVSTKLFVWGLNDKRQLGMSSACDESVSAGNADCLSNGANGSASTTNQELKVPH